MFDVFARLLGIGAISVINNGKTEKKIREMDDNPYCTIKTDAWYKEHNTTPEEQTRLRVQKILLNNAKNNMK